MHLERSDWSVKSQGLRDDKRAVGRGLAAFTKSAG